jgi:hypothetical protein
LRKKIKNLSKYRFRKRRNGVSNDVCLGLRLGEVLVVVFGLTRTINDNGAVFDKGGSVRIAGGMEGENGIGNKASTGWHVK